MKIRKLTAAVGLVSALVLAPSAAAFGEGATVVDCSVIFEGLSGKIIFTPDGDLLANCYEHTMETETPAEGNATIVSCEEALGVEGAIGIQVITPTGSVFTNCHVHFLS